MSGSSPDLDGDLYNGQQNGPQNHNSERSPANAGHADDWRGSLGDPQFVSRLITEIEGLLARDGIDHLLNGADHNRPQSPKATSITDRWPNVNPSDPTTYTNHPEFSVHESKPDAQLNPGLDVLLADVQAYLDSFYLETAKNTGGGARYGTASNHANSTATTFDEDDLGANYGCIPGLTARAVFGAGKIIRIILESDPREPNSLKLAKLFDGLSGGLRRSARYFLQQTQNSDPSDWSQRSNARKFKRVRDIDHYRYELFGYGKQKNIGITFERLNRSLANDPQHAHRRINNLHDQIWVTLNRGGLYSLQINYLNDQGLGDLVTGLTTFKINLAVLRSMGVDLDTILPPNNKKYVIDDESADPSIKTQNGPINPIQSTLVVEWRASYMPRVWVETPGSDYGGEPDADWSGDHTEYVDDPVDEDELGDTGGSVNLDTSDWADNVPYDQAETAMRDQNGRPGQLIYVKSGDNEEPYQTICRVVYKLMRDLR